jgi:hypothetical protein
MHRTNEYISHLAEVFEVLMPTALMLQRSRMHAFTALGVQFSVQIQPKEIGRGLFHTLAAISSLFSISFLIVRAV